MEAVTIRKTVRKNKNRHSLIARIAVVLVAVPAVSPGQCQGIKSGSPVSGIILSVAGGLAIEALIVASPLAVNLGRSVVPARHFDADADVLERNGSPQG